MEKPFKIVAMGLAFVVLMAWIARDPVMLALAEPETEVIVEERGIPVSGEVVVELPDGEIMSSTFGPDAEKVVLSSDDVFVMLSIGEGEAEEPVDLSSWEPEGGTESEGG